MILERLFSADFRRRRLLAASPAGPLHDYLTAPWPDPATACDAGVYLALDLETTGGDPRRDAIVSFGWVCIDGLRIDLGSARHHIVRVDGAISASSAVIHAITDDEAARGDALATVLGKFLTTLRGRVLIAHHAATELGFVGEACRHCYGSRVLIPAIDTLDIAGRRLARSGQAPVPGSLRLGSLRRQHNLPRYPAHNALSDALSAAELFLALVSETGTRPRLGDLLFRQ
jgi:DNA polymerase-3 subunit epsilon